MGTARAMSRILPFFSAVLVCAIVQNALACSCVKYSLEKRFNRYDVIFSGVVESSKEAPDSYKKIWRLKTGEEFVYSSLKVKLKVKDVWKGELDRFTLLYTSNPAEDTCGYHFEEKGSYVVFANYRKTPNDGGSEESDSHLWTSWCYWNIDLDDVKEKRALVRKLRRLKSELEEEGEVDESQAGDIHRTPKPTEVLDSLDAIIDRKL